MANNFSPSPWKVHESATHARVLSNDGELLFTDLKSCPGVIEDARLIAAAPELLAALEDAAMSLKTISQRAGRDELMDTMPDVRAYASSRAEVAAAAIAKARGE